jgi:hypothetical protein
MIIGTLQVPKFNYNYLTKSIVTEILFVSERIFNFVIQNELLSITRFFFAFNRKQWKIMKH